MKLLNSLFVGLYIGFIASLILNLIAISCAHAEGKENWFIQVDELSLNYKRYNPGSRHPLFYDSVMKEGIDLNMNTDMAFGLLFWDNKIHTATNSAQYYLIGWNLFLGIHVTSFLDVQYEHHSQHILDDAYPNMKFPVEDSLGFKLTLIGGGRRGISLF